MKRAKTVKAEGLHFSSCGDAIKKFMGEDVWFELLPKPRKPEDIAGGYYHVRVGVDWGKINVQVDWSEEVIDAVIGNFCYTIIKLEGEKFLVFCRFGWSQSSLTGSLDDCLSIYLAHDGQRYFRIRPKQVEEVILKRVVETCLNSESIPSDAIEKEGIVLPHFSQGDLAVFKFPAGEEGCFPVEIAKKLIDELNKKQLIVMREAVARRGFFSVGDVTVPRGSLIGKDLPRSAGSEAMKRARTIILPDGRVMKQSSCGHNRNFRYYFHFVDEKVDIEKINFSEWSIIGM
jgi:hypothetical protein